jgi:hypothetical protein
MRSTCVILLIIFCAAAQAQSHYHARFASAIEEIKQEDAYNNSLVVCSAENYYCSNLPLWNRETEFYQDDLVNHGTHTYRALSYSRGNTPADTSKFWARTYRPRPYFFLRDTARIEDLKALLENKNPRVKCYALGALVYRNVTDDLFNVVLENLDDKRRFVQYTGDFGYEVCAADVMMWYALPFFNNVQKDQLRKIILKKHSHLITLDEILLFHRPSSEDYRSVKALIKLPPFRRKFAIVALAAYRRRDDLTLILSALKGEDAGQSYRGHQIMLRAIENFPSPEFKYYLLDQPKECADWWVDELYIRALASYKDEDVLKRIAHFVNCSYSEYQLEICAIIYRNLLRHQDPIYGPLLNQLKERLGDKDPNSISPNSLDGSPWNF